MTGRPEQPTPRTIPIHRALAVLALGLAACGAPEREVAPGAFIPRFDPPEGGPPPARQEQVVDEFHGTAVADPYRWLEDIDAEEVTAWIRAQDRHTEAWLSKVEEREAIRERLTELWSFPRWSAPERHGDRWAWTFYDGVREQPVLMVGSAPDADGRVLLDPNTLSADGTVSVGPLAWSEDGCYLAWARSEAGSDWRTWRVLDVETGETLQDELRWSKFAGAAWTHDGAGFFYQRFARPAEGEEREAATRGAQLCYHRLGTSQDDDVVVYERPDEPTWGFRPEVTDDGRYLVVEVSSGTDRRNRVLFADLEVEGWPVEPLVAALEASFDYAGSHGSEAFFVTDRDAERGVVVAVDLARPVPEAWRIVVPESVHVLEAATVVGGELLLTYLEDAADALLRYAPDGRLLGRVELPSLGRISRPTGDADDTVTYFTFESFVHPPSVHRYVLGEAAAEVVRAPDLDLDPAQFEVQRVSLLSGDGTSLRMFLVHRPGLRLDGSNPTLLYGYGGFGIAMRPAFSAERLAFVERGGVFAQAILRGGGEYGVPWHEAGMRERKQQVFDDFLSAARYLVRNDYTVPERLAIHGRSNGGLLVGAVLVQAPEQFGAAICEVGVLDMLRYHRFTIGWAWEPEYGSADDPEMFPVLRAYSPLHNVRPASYPPTLITTGDHDDRVMPAHSYKFAAALQAAQEGPAPILLDVTFRAGHGGGKPTSLRIAEATDRLAFLAMTIQR